MKKTEFLRFLSFDNVFSDQPKIVRNKFARVIFGVTRSPFLLKEAIRKHVKNYEFGIDFANKTLDCFYVDGFTSGESDFYKALDLFKKLKLRFLDGHFHLCKWRTSDPKLRKIILENTSNSLQPGKVLGILWEEVDDLLVFDFSEICETYQTLDITKQNVLKILAMFYDPIGLLQPILINLKRLFQEIVNKNTAVMSFYQMISETNLKKLCFLCKIWRKFPLIEMFYYKWLPTRNRIAWFQ